MMRQLAAARRGGPPPTLNFPRPVDWMASTLCSAVLTFLLTCSRTGRADVGAAIKRMLRPGTQQWSGGACAEVVHGSGCMGHCGKLRLPSTCLPAAPCLHCVSWRLGQACTKVDGEGGRHGAQADQQAPAEQCRVAKPLGFCW